MSINKKDIEKLLTLSELHVSDKEKEDLHQQMGTILDYMSVINELDLNELQPTSYSNQDATFLRDDVVSSTPIDMKNNAPHWEGQAFGVPSILGE